MDHILPNSQLILENGIISGNIKNCFIRFDTIPDTAALEIFFPKNVDEDRWELRDVLNEPYIAGKEWIDSGLRLLLKDIPSKKLLSTTEPLINKVIVYFSGKYPNDVFKRYKHYTCGKLSRIILLHINDTVVLKYCEELRADFTKNFIKVIFDNTEKCEKIYINTYELGTLEYKNGSIEMHRWENEDEAQSAGYLSRRYTQRLLDGVINGADIKTGMIMLIKSSISQSTIEPDDFDLFEKALDILEKQENRL
jgi:hypothetical protein